MGSFASILRCLQDVSFAPDYERTNDADRSFVKTGKGSTLVNKNVHVAILRKAWLSKSNIFDGRLSPDLPLSFSSREI